jgi:YjbE family integral membrane protein
MDALLHPWTTEAVSILGEVLLINVVLSGDNAIVVGLAAAGLPAAQRLRALWLGIALATALRLIFAAVATGLLRILGLALAGGILLLWVAWKMWRDIAGRRGGDAATHRRSGAKSLREALTQIIVADISMSLDNALAVAGAAFEHPAILAAGLVISVLLMGGAASLMARLLEQFRWVAHLGLLIILYVALKMVWEGAHEVLGAVT